MTLSLPALRERSDFAALVARLLDEHAPGRGAVLDASLAAAFADHAWPGNLRQLANALRTACALLDAGESVIGWSHLPDDLAEDLRQPALPKFAPAIDADKDLRSLSNAVIGRAVAMSDGNMSEAARRLGISRNTLYRRLKRLPAGALREG
jgi:transcriptional regulator of acetoin/glycerol metabolism